MVCDKGGGIVMKTTETKIKTKIKTKTKTKSTTKTKTKAEAKTKAKTKTKTKIKSDEGRKHLSPLGAGGTPGRNNDAPRVEFVMEWS